MRQEVVTVDVDLVRLVADLVARFQFFNGFCVAGSRQEGWQPVMVADDFIAEHPRFDLARPTEQAGYPESAFPVRVFLTSKWRHSSVWPRVHVWPIIGAVHDDG